jgi:hypothetical protein
VALVAALTFCLVLLAGSASATVKTHTFNFSFGGSGTNTLGSAVGIAVDNSAQPSSGSVYVGDAVNNRVEKFDPNGNFLLMFGDEVNETSGGDVCPRPGFPADVCKAGTEGSAAGQFSEPKYIVVDWTNGSSAGDVYVLDPINQIVQKFAPTGDLITSWGGPPERAGRRTARCQRRPHLWQMDQRAGDRRRAGQHPERDGPDKQRAAGAEDLHLLRERELHQDPAAQPAALSERALDRHARQHPRRRT